MLRELLPSYLTIAILVGSLFPAALVLQAGIAIDLWIQRMAAPRPPLVKIYRALNLCLIAVAVLFILAASVMAVRWGAKALTPRPELGVPTGWPAAPS